MAHLEFKLDDCIMLGVHIELSQVPIVAHSLLIVLD
jgi:hypothetical protein